MKNLKNLTVISAVMIVFLSSCQNNDPKPLPDPVYMYSYKHDYTVKATDWKLGQDDASGNYFYCEFKEPNLTQDIYDYGTLQAFLYLTGDNISPLPFDDFWVDPDTGYMWTEQVTCEFRPGYVTFILKYNDHLTDNTPSYDQYDFRVQFTYSDYYH